MCGSVTLIYSGDPGRVPSILGHPRSSCDSTGHASEAQQKQKFEKQKQQFVLNMYLFSFALHWTLVQQLTLYVEYIYRLELGWLNSFCRRFQCVGRCRAIVFCLYHCSFHGFAGAVVMCAQFVHACYCVFKCVCSVPSHAEPIGTREL